MQRIVTLTERKAAEAARRAAAVAELVPVLAECMAYCQQIIGFFTEPIMTVVMRVLPLTVPDWYRDLWVISFVLTSLNLQAALIEIGEGNTVPRLVRLLLNMFFGVCILGLAALNAVILLGLATPFLALRDLRNKNDATTAKTCLASVALAALAAVAFFALNSQLQDAAMAGSQDGLRSLPAVAPPL